MAEFEIVFWHWWILAVVMLGVELLASGFLFLWLSIAGFIVGLVLLLTPTTSLEIQLLIFATLSMVSIYVWRRFGVQSQTETDHPLLNKRGEQYIGRTFFLSEAIENGRGKIKAEDSIWTVLGKDCPVKSKVRVTAVEGSLFQVELILDKTD